MRYAGGHRISLEIESDRAARVDVEQRRLARGDPAAALLRVPQPVARRRRRRSHRRWRCWSCSPATRCGDRTLSAAATGAAAMQFGLGIDGVVLLFVAFRHLTSTGLDADDAATTALEGSASSMLLGMWTTAATFYGLMLVDFPSLEELGAVIGHSMVLCGVLTLDPGAGAAAAADRARAAAHVVVAGALRRAARRGRCSSRPLLVTAALGARGARGIRIDPSLDRLRANTAGTAFEQEVATRFGVPQDVYVVTASGPDARAAARSQRSAGRAARRASAPRRRRAGASACCRRSARRRAAAAPFARAGADAADGRGATRAARRRGRLPPGTFDPFVERLPGLLDARARLTYDGFVSHHLDDLLSRSIVAARRRLDARHLRLSAHAGGDRRACAAIVATSAAHDADRRARSEPRARRALRAGVPQGPAAGTLLVLVADRRHLPAPRSHAARAGADRSSR